MKNYSTGSDKMKRQNFFKYAGGAVLGLITLANMPFKIFQSNGTVKKASIKITENPNAVKRNHGVSPKGQAKNG